MKTLRFFFVFAVALGLSLGMVQLVARADAVATLEKQANNDAIAEFRLAAALALVDTYVNTKSISELEAIAGDTTNSAELRTGAAEALGRLYVKGVTDGTITQSDLLNVALGGATAELRSATSAALVDRLLANASLDNLVFSVPASSGSGNDELATIEAKALVIKLAVSLTSGSPASIIDKTESVASGGSISVGGVTLDGSSEIVQRAVASEYLSGFYIQFGSIVFPDLEAALTQRAQTGASVGIREAAAIALETVSFSGKSSSELEALATNGASAELRAAAGRALARALIAEGASRDALILKVVANSSVHVAVATAAAAALALKLSA